MTVIWKQIQRHANKNILLFYGCCEINKITTNRSKNNEHVFNAKSLHRFCAVCIINSLVNLFVICWKRSMKCMWLSLCPFLTRIQIGRNLFTLHRGLSSHWTLTIFLPDVYCTYNNTSAVVNYSTNRLEQQLWCLINTILKTFQLRWHVRIVFTSVIWVRGNGWNPLTITSRSMHNGLIDHFNTISFSLGGIGHKRMLNQTEKNVFNKFYLWRSVSVCVSLCVKVRRGERVWVRVCVRERDRKRERSQALKQA